MANFENALDKVLQFEGFYSNDPDDQGAETIFGVSRKFNRDWQGWKIVDKYKMLANFPECLKDNIELVEDVKWIYRHKYWNQMLGDKILNQNIANHLFDACVNMGQISIKYMQKAICDVKSSEKNLTPFVLSCDGVMGNNTLNALNGCKEDILLDNFKELRIDYYKKYSNPKYLNGLVRRAES